MKRAALPVALALLTTGCDQATKHLARDFLAVHGTASFFGGLLSVVPAENAGAFLGFGGALPPALRSALLVGLTAAGLLAGAIVLLRRPHGTVVTVAGALLLGGGVGNLVDRVTRDGLVSDFLFLRLGPLHTGIFNVADLAITCGALALMAAAFAPRRPEKGGADL